MDRSFLSHPEVVAASRRFVCVRLATYEDAREVEFLTRIWGSTLQNTVFCLLSPQKNERITRAGRSPKRLFESADAMAEEMHEIAADYTPRGEKFEALGLPYLKDLRIALNVAACDAQPLVVVHDRGGGQGNVDDHVAPPRALVKVAWRRPAIGKFLYVRATEKELAVIRGAKTEPGISLVTPNAYGTAGELVTWLPLDASRETIVAALAKMRASHKDNSKSSNRHIRDARRLGIRWQSKTPGTDDHETGRRRRGSRRGSRGERGRRRGSERRGSERRKDDR